MISRSNTHDNRHAKPRATADSMTATSINSRFRSTSVTPRTVFNVSSAASQLVRTLLWILTLSTSTHALAWEATIERDALGVPHIFGETDADMAYGLAWAQSEDGWEILEETLPYYRGNAASFFGRDAAVTDYLIQWLGFWEVIDRDYDLSLIHISEPTRPY